MFQVGRYPLEQENMFNFTKNQIFDSVINSLNLLGVDYIDLIQVIFRLCTKYIFKMQD